MNNTKRWLSRVAIIMMMVLMLATTVFGTGSSSAPADASAPAEENVTVSAPAEEGEADTDGATAEEAAVRMVPCTECYGDTHCPAAGCQGEAAPCTLCEGSGTCADCQGTGFAVSESTTIYTPNPDCEDCSGIGLCKTCAPLCESCEGSGICSGKILCPDCLNDETAKKTCDSCEMSGFLDTTDCTTCHGDRICPTCEGSGEIESPCDSKFFFSPWALLPAVIAIVLALITKEVYSSLFIGILAGGLMYANFNLVGAWNHVFNDGIIASLAGPDDGAYNTGILVFLVILGAMVCLMNRAGGSAAFGRWAEKHIKSRVGAQLASILLGCLIFIDDYFNCLTVGSVMRPVADKHKISRAKLSYIIDATAAPVCIIAPISSWAAAVSGFAEDGQGFNLFLRAIPYNFYALLTIVMMLGLVIMKVDFGPMAKHERNAMDNGDLFSGANEYANAEGEAASDKGIVMDLLFPVISLIICCVIGMIYSGHFFDATSDSYRSFQVAFSESDASVGLMLGSAVALIITMVYYMIRRSMKFKDMMGAIPEGFKAMVPAILILIFAWTLKTMTDSLGAKYFVAALVKSASGIQFLLPLIVFAVGCVLAFATGTSWGTFGILIPIVQSALPADNALMIVCISACMAGAVCGDHCSPISDTTIMASAGAQCNHVNHVSTQLPYAISCAVISGITYLIAGVLGMVGAPTIIALPVGIVLMLGFLLIMKRDQKK